MFKIGIFLNKFPNIPFPLIRVIGINFDFNLLQFMQLPITFGSLFLVTFLLTFFDFAFFYKIYKKFPLCIIIHINSFFEKSLKLNNAKNFIKLFLLSISYKINKTQNIPHKLLVIS